MLAGKAVVVTGAGRGLGRAYAVHAAASGASVVVNDVDAETADAVAAEIGNSGGRAVASSHGVDRADDAWALIELCVEQFGAIDGLVNNAGLIDVGPAWEATPAAMRRLVEVNVLGVLYCGTAALQRMRTQGAGVVVNVTSGAHLGLPLRSVYGATKGAVASVTYGWAMEMAPHGVSVIGLSPRADTRMSTSPDMASPDGVAPIVVYLLTGQAHALRGQVVRFDGSRVSVLSQPRFAGPFVDVGDGSSEALSRALRDAQPDGIGSVGFAEVDLSGSAR
jgi:NAD(P)-dependent dehydrogenase (short-subunit alcohol dehydrogenase family)